MVAGSPYTYLMTTTRINHTGHAHPSTTAARTACRKAMKATPAPVVTVPTCLVGMGRAVHRAVMNDDTLIGARCGAGLKRDGSDSNYIKNGNLPISSITCHAKACN